VSAEGTDEGSSAAGDRGASSRPTRSLAFLDTLGVPQAARRRLAGLRIGVVGLEGHGAHAASTLAASGVGTLLLVDPYPCQAGNLALMPFVGRDAVGLPREQALKAAIEARGTAARLELGGGGAVTREGVDALVSDCHLVIGGFGGGLLSAQYWLNGASLRHGVPALYAELNGHVALVGPLVLPGQTACFMCWRMRTVACAASFSDAMAREELLEHERRPALHERATVPALAPYAGGLAALEALKSLLFVGPGTLAGRVHEFDALAHRTEVHTVLQVPDCPRCKGARPWRRAPPALDELTRSARGGDGLLSAEPSLVSRRCGVVSAFQRFPKDPSEPARPYLFAAAIANHRFVEGPGPEHLGFSGKGMTPTDARASALGEAVERYSGACWLEEEILRGRRDELGGPSLDPRELVLYEPAQYAILPYAPYEDTTTMGWVPARSIVSGEETLVPALAVFMGYQPRSREEYLFPATSNGLAAHTSLADAVLAAALEVLERDAFLITWMNRLPTWRVVPSGHPDADLVELCAAYRRHDVDLQLYRLPTDNPCHVFMALAVERGDAAGPAVTVGLGADLAAARAARKALLEACQVRPVMRLRMRSAESQSRIGQLLADPHLVTTLEDHALLYADSRARGAFDFLWDHQPTTFDWTVTDVEDGAHLWRLAEHFRSRGGDALAIDVTPPDMARLGLHTARVVVPGFQPLHHGWNGTRLAGRRLADVPHRLGLVDEPTTLERRNDDPHPLA
jgi:ribosomal protein S12 methylthiotransferase accessory factor